MRGRESDNLGQLRSWRVHPDRDVSIDKQIRTMVRAAAAQQAHSGGAAAAWEAGAPAGLRKLCHVQSVSAGVLNVKAASAAARFQLDRWLRSGGEELLRGGGVKRVRIV